MIVCIDGTSKQRPYMNINIQFHRYAMLQWSNCNQVPTLNAFKKGSSTNFEWGCCTTSYLDKCNVISSTHLALPLDEVDTQSYKTAGWLTNHHGVQFLSPLFQISCDESWFLKYHPHLNNEITSYQIKWNININNSWKFDVINFNF